MTSSTSSLALLTPFNLRDLTLDNRVVLAPMTRARSGKDRIPNSLMAEYYAQRANAGLLITEATVISKQAIGWSETPGIYTQAQADGWKQVVDHAHAAGSRIFIQLWHCGRASHSAFQEGGQLPVAPSAIKISNDEIHTPDGKQPYETPRALETDEIPQIVEDYRHTAELAKTAGFDGIEIHSANGYLLDEFLQSKTNHRTDRYGGSLEKRFQIHREVFDAVLSVWPAERVGIRLSPNGVYNDMGSPDYRETFLYTAKELNNYGLAYIHLMDGLAFGFHELGEPMTLPEFRAVFAGPIIANCGYTKEAAEIAIKDNRADLVAFGRPYISNPDLVQRFANDWPLAEADDMSTWYSPGKEGYTDYPTYQAA
ncbi:MAG: alkene reductase [Cyanobacteria bacterium J06626_23]